MEIAAQYPVKAIIGFDAHAPEHLERRDLYDKGLKFLQSLGIGVLAELPGGKCRQGERPH